MNRQKLSSGVTTVRLVNFVTQTAQTHISYAPLWSPYGEHYCLMSTLSFDNIGTVAHILYLRLLS